MQYVSLETRRFYRASVRFCCINNLCINDYAEINILQVLSMDTCPNYLFAFFLDNMGHMSFIIETNWWKIGVNIPH